MKLMSVGVWVSDSLVRPYKSWFKAVFFFFLVCLSTKWSESFISEFNLCPAASSLPLFLRNPVPGEAGGHGGDFRGTVSLRKTRIVVFGTLCVPKPPFCWISLLYLVLADHFSSTSGVHGRGENLLRLQGHSR